MPDPISVQAPAPSASFRTEMVSPQVTAGLTALGLLGALYAAATLPASALPTPAKVWMIAWLALSVAVTLRLTPRNFTAGFLIGLFAMLVGWRIAGLHGVSVVTYPLLLAFAAFVVQFFDCVFADRALGPRSAMRIADWHLAFVRLYIGFDMVPHFTEKLFAGPGPFMDDVKAFAGFGLPMPELFVFVGGLTEFAIAIGVGMGLLTRLAGAGAALYFFIATVIGGHFGLGFIWANPGGGWEYPELMMVLFLSYIFTGGGAFSLDRALSDKGWLPAALRRFT
jgi:putative oxidoreductase